MTRPKNATSPLRDVLNRMFPTFANHLGSGQELTEELPGETLLHQVAGLLRGGVPVHQAWNSLNVGTDQHGLPKVADLQSMLGTKPTKDMQRQAQGVIVACKLAHELGIPLANLLIVVAGTIDDSQRSISQRERALAGPAATSKVLLWLPLIGVFLGAALGTQPLTWLLGSPLGWVCLTAGIGLLLTGRAWSNRLMNRAIEAGTAQ